MTIYSVYWIHYPEHENIQTDGYVGISKNPTRRLIEHKQSKSNFKVKSALKRGAEMKIVQENLSEDQAKKLEFYLRPTDNIGWNIVAGGGMPPCAKGKKFPHRKHFDRSGECNPMFGRSGELSPTFGLRRTQSDKEKAKRALTINRNRKSESTKSAMRASWTDDRRKEFSEQKKLNNPSRDETIYKFFHEKHGIFIGKRSELSNQYSGVGSKELMYVILGKQKQHKGWTFVS